MANSTNPVSDYDIVIAGGGTCACVIASRLSSADPNLRILMLEAGPPTHEDLAHVQPARFLTHLRPTSTTVKFMVGKKSNDLGGKAPIVPRGACLGGGSSVNFTMYTRPSASDFDDWEKMWGNPGWGCTSLMPFLKKLETYQAVPDLPTHGYDGPLKVSLTRTPNVLADEFLAVASQYDTYRSYTNDPSGIFDVNAYARWPRWIDEKTGRRSDVPHHYLYNQGEKKNLEIKTGHLVKRVIFEGTRAVGVEYVPDKNVSPDVPQQVYVARARRMVIVSAGTFGSPSILERSGIGAASLLQGLGISTLVDLPGVGENYQDHQGLASPYLVDESVPTIDGIVRGNTEEIAKWTAQWLKDGSGLMASNAIDAGVKYRPSDEELKEIGPDFKQHWNEYFADSPDKPVIWLGPFAQYAGYAPNPPNKCCNMGFFIEYPQSRGSVHITSADDVQAPPDFDPQFLKHKGDVALLRWAYKRGREIARRMPSYRGEFAPDHPAFSEGSQAFCNMEASPVDLSEPNIEYTPEDDYAIDTNNRKHLNTIWHSLGTCAMKARKDDGVVDSSLSVYGVTNLKVADMSIAPSNVSSNTYSVALVIAEKAASLIMQELGI
ncbi:GMC oxidoreductase [Wolfiporia cocos MD-104 SS10]|uniref:GMC oxidoreductase n=1 Tax=Wolfiporia cocos (strain MD-104) TaxID=742152 RepID=A0A2H3JLM4_WOLCO|nr:GMC oxidoreductase [Wolfiporia cocos MD-104 SS10]